MMQPVPLQAMDNSVQAKPPQEMQKTVEVKPPQGMETTMVVKPPPALETTMQATPPRTEPKVEVKQRKRSWARIFKKLFKRKKIDPTIESSQNAGEKQTVVPTAESTAEATPGEKQAPSLPKEGPVEATASSGDTYTQEGEVQVQVKLQVTPRSSQGVPGPQLDEHKIDGLKSAGGRFMPCLPKILNDKSNVQNSTFGHGHTLISSTHHHVSAKAEVPDSNRKFRKGCLPISPRAKDVPQAAYKTSKRGKTSKLPCNRRNRAVNHAHARRTKQGCFPQLTSRGSSPSEDPKGSRFTFLHVDEHGNYGRISEDGSINSKELTYLEFKEGCRYEPMVEVLKDDEMTYLDLDKEGKYESSRQQKASNATDAKLKVESPKRKTGGNRGHRIHSRTSITSIESDDESSDIFQIPEQQNSHGSLPMTDPSSALLRQSMFQSQEQLNNKISLLTSDPSSTLLRQSISEDASHHNMDPLPNSFEANDVSNDQGEQNERFVVTNSDIKVERGSTKGWLPMTKHGSKSYFFPPKEGTLKEALPSIDSVEANVDISRNNEWNHTSDLLDEQISQDGDSLKNRCLRLQPLRWKFPKSRNNDELSDPLLHSPPDLLQEEVGKSPQKKKDDRDLRNRCLGLQPLKFNKKKPLPATGVEDLTNDDYNYIADFEEPWKGEEVADFELRDFKRLKSIRKSRPVISSKEKKGSEKTSLPPIATNHDHNGDKEDDAGSDDENDWDNSKPSRGCLPFGLRSTTDSDRNMSRDIVSPPLESYTKEDIYRAVDQLQGADCDMDCTGTVIMSVDSDDETHSMEISELDIFSKSNPVSDAPWDDSYVYKATTGCLPFERKLQNLPELGLGSEVDLDLILDLQSNDPQSIGGEARKTNWDDLNENVPQRGCFPFGRNDKKDYLEGKVMSTELGSVQSIEPQIEEAADERQREESSSRNLKKWCLPFYRQRTDYIELASTSMDAADTAPGTGRETVDQNVNGEAEENTQCPLLSDWQEQTSNQETNWFPSNCFSNKPAESPFGPAANGTNQVRVDLELRNTEMHSCLPCVQKSRKGKLLFIQSGPNSGNSFEIELDIDNPPKEVGDETTGNEHPWHRSRDGCLPLGFKSGKEYLLENSTRIKNDEQSITSTELQGRDSAPDKRFTCADHIFTLKKLKPTPCQNASRPQNDVQSNALFQTAPEKEDLHEFPQTGCAGFSRKRNSKKGDENVDMKHAVPASGPTPGAALASVDAPSQRKEEETGSAQASCGPWNKKPNCNTGVVELLLEMGGCDTLDREDRGVHTQDSSDNLGETSCGKFWSPKDPGRKAEESAARSGKSSCGMFWMPKSPEKFQQSEKQSAHPNCGKFWIKQDPQKQIEQSVDQPTKTTCGKLWTKQDPTESVGESVEPSRMSGCSRLSLGKGSPSPVEVEVDESGRVNSSQEDVLKLLEDTLDEVGSASSNQERVLKVLEDTLAKSKSSYCGKLPATQDILKQLRQAIEKARRTGCDGSSMGKKKKNELEVFGDESERDGSNQERILKELEETLAKTKNSNCGKLPVTQDILKQFQQAIERSRRPSCGGSLMRRNSRDEREVFVDESGRANLNQEHLLKELEDTLAETRSSTCGKLPVTQDILRQFQQAIERSRRTSCSALPLRKKSKNELEMLVDESGRANQERILKEDEDTQAESKCSYCSKCPTTEDTMRQLQRAIKRSRNVLCDGLSMSKISPVLVDESGRTTPGKLLTKEDVSKQSDEGVKKQGWNSCTKLFTSQNAPNLREVLVDEHGITTCAKFLKKQDAIKQFDKTAGKTSGNGLSTSQNELNQLEVVVDESGRPSGRKQLTKQDSKIRSDNPLDKPESTSSHWKSVQNSAREKSAEEDKSGEASWGRFLTEPDVRTKKMEEAAQEPEKPTCDNIAIKRDETSQFEKFPCDREKSSLLPLKQGEKNRLGEAIHELRMTTCGAVSMGPDPPKKFEEIAQKAEKTLGYDDVFVLKQDPPKGVHPTREIGKGVEKCTRNLAEYTHGRISTFLGVVCNQRVDGAHLTESEITPLISNGARSRKGFLKRYCACMVASDNSSSGSRCNEAPVMEEGVNKYPDLSLQGFKSQVGVDCMPCFPQGKVAATPNTSDTIDSNIQSNNHSFPASPKVTTMDKDPRLEAQGELWTPESKNGSERSARACSYGRMPDWVQGGCGIPQMNPFWKCASQTSQDGDLGFSVNAESDPLSQRHIADDQQQPSKPSSQKSNRERWMPYMGKDSETGILKPFHSRDGPEPPVLETESRSDEQDGYQSSLEKLPEPGVLNPLSSSNSPELQPGVEVRHSCHTFRSSKRPDASLSVVSSTSSKEIGENWKHRERPDSASLPTSRDCSKEWNRNESQASTQERPENKWLRREAREPLAEQKSAFTGKLRKGWPQDDDTASGTQGSTPLNKNLDDQWSRDWQKEPLEGYFDQTGNEEKTFRPQTSTNSQDSSFEDGWGRNQKTVPVTEMYKLNKQPVPQFEFESQGMIPEDEPAVAGVYPRGDGYRSMEVNTTLLTSERNPEDEDLDIDQTSLDSKHQCLGRNWQKHPKQESVDEALKASETLLKKLNPIRLPEFESGQAESSSSGLSQSLGTCCLTSLFQTKEKRQPKRTYTKDVEIQASTCCPGLQQTNNTTAKVIITKVHTASVSTQNSQEIIQEENKKRKKQKTTISRRVRGSSTPVGEFDERQIHSSKKARGGDFGAHAELKHEPFIQITTQKEEFLEFKDQSSPNWRKKVEAHKSKGDPTACARNKFPTISCHKPPEPSVDRARQERVSEELDSQNCHTANSDKKSPCSLQPKTDQCKTTKKVQSRPLCATNLFACTRWTSDEDSEGVKHQGHLVSGEKKTSGRKPNTYSSRTKGHAHIAIPGSSTDDSSSGDDIYDIASKRFRDNLFKNKNRDNSGVGESRASRAISSTKDGVKNYQQSTGDKQSYMRGSPGDAVRPTILQKFEESDDFCRSPVFKELVAVESQIRDISKIIAGIAGPDYLDAIEESEHKLQDGNVSSEDEARPPKGRLSGYRSKLWFAQMKEPVSVKMASRLAGDEVPVYYDEGFQVGYLPIAYRGSKGMRKTKKAEELDQEYSKFMDQKVKPPSDDDGKNVYYVNTTTGKQPKKRFSQKFTAKRLLHEKQHPHDHRNSAVVQVEVTPEYSSSSSSWSWKEDLILSHRKVFRKDLDAMSIRKKSPLNGDSDSDGSSPSPRAEMPSVFMGHVDEELARLKIARKQLEEGLQEPITNTLPYKLESCNKFRTGTTGGDSHCDGEEDFQSDDSDFVPVRSFKGKSVKNSTDCAGVGNSCLGRANKSDTDDDSPRGRQYCRGSSRRIVQNFSEFSEDDSARPCAGLMGGCMSSGRGGSPSKARRALENNEFQLLQRRVRKDLGGKRKTESAKTAQHSHKEEMIEQLKQVGALRSEPATNLVEDCSEGAENVHVKFGPRFAESNQEIPSGNSYLIEEDNAPVSSLVKLMFGTPMATSHAERTQESANKLQAAEVLIQEKVGELEAEIANFQETNRRLGVMMKENAAHMSRLMQDRAAWEVQKKADMLAFQQYKETQMNKLQKEKRKMEHQTRAQIPKKEERKEIEELRAKLAEEHELHLKKELQWRQTSNRLRGVNDDLKKQIHELRKEIGWHEDRLLLDAAAKSSDYTSNNARQKAHGTWNANRSTTNENVVCQPREKARQERNVKTSTIDPMHEALHPAKFKVEIIEKNEPPTRSKLDTVHKGNNNNRAKEYLNRDNSTAPALDTLSNCEDATAALATRMKLLEKEVQQWINVHSKHGDQSLY